MALEDVPAYDPDKEEGTQRTSLVLSGSELITMNDSQWKQVLAVRSISLPPSPSLTNELGLVRRTGLCEDVSEPETPDRARVPSLWIDCLRHGRRCERRERAQAGGRRSRRRGRK